MLKVRETDYEMLRRMGEDLELAVFKAKKRAYYLKRAAEKVGPTARGVEDFAGKIHDEMMLVDQQMANVTGEIELDLGGLLGVRP